MKTIVFRDEKNYVKHRANAHEKEVDMTICRELARYNMMFGKNPAEISICDNKDHQHKRKKSNKR